MCRAQGSCHRCPLACSRTLHAARPLRSKGNAAPLLRLFVHPGANCQRESTPPLRRVRRRGWRTFKRPGVEDLIRNMAQYYELVVYTSQLPTYADPILDRLDPQRMIQYRRAGGGVAGLGQCTQGQSAWLAGGVAGPRLPELVAPEVLRRLGRAARQSASGCQSQRAPHCRPGGPGPRHA